MSTRSEVNVEFIRTSTANEPQDPVCCIHAADRADFMFRAKKQHSMATPGFLVPSKKPMADLVKIDLSAREVGSIFSIVNNDEDDEGTVP